ncbi:hypothetical protein [Nostoc sp. MS1]|uniref:hypothetical protein n=1 Tax=Nostoc sp. MS1 TaxID=2764711 RepID=UPI001CC5345E|nr:hypothetical protein [Nostoc sp. MS1]BCL34587.1 hypothetical protein NSMS1_10340 [Nostoc sp. MS1]
MYSASFSSVYRGSEFVSVLYVYRSLEGRQECRKLEGKQAQTYYSALAGAHSKQQVLSLAFTRAKAYEENTTV